MTDIQRITYKVTLIKLFGLMFATASICFTIAFYVTDIKKTLEMHEYRLSKIEGQISGPVPAAITTRLKK